MDRRSAFSLLEVLVVIALVALLLAIALPSLAAARERSRVAICLSRCRSLGIAMQCYHGDNGNLPWFYIHRKVGDQFLLYPGAGEFTSFSFGGMLPASSVGVVDSQVVPAELRPLNAWMAPQARWTDHIAAYVCPSDSSSANPGVESAAASAALRRGVSNWQRFGTSYSINWHWVRDRSKDRERGTPQAIERQLYRAGPSMLRRADPARFVWGSENHLDQLMVAAGKRGGGIQAMGWHGVFSQHSAIYLDGHATNHHMDTRSLSGTDWTFSPPR